MTQPTRADTSVPIHPHLAARWSPRVFDATAALSSADLAAVLEAARWSATWGDRQPVRFVVGLRGDQTFEALAATLKRGNSYAKSAAALILVCADQGPDEKTALYSAVDAGAAIANATVEAVSRGLVAHPMAGFDGAAARQAFDVPEDVRPLAILAIGVLGDYATAQAELVERDSRPRSRLPLSDIAFAGRWGRPLTPSTPSTADSPGPRTGR